MGAQLPEGGVRGGEGIRAPQARPSVIDFQGCGLWVGWNDWAGNLEGQSRTVPVGWLSLLGSRLSLSGRGGDEGRVEVIQSQIQNQNYAGSDPIYMYLLTYLLK